MHVSPLLILEFFGSVSLAMAAFSPLRAAANWLGRGRRFYLFVDISAYNPWKAGPPSRSVQNTVKERRSMRRILLQWTRLKGIS